MSGSNLSSLIARAITLARGPLAKGSIASLAIKLAAILLVFVQAIVAARLLGAEGLGMVAIVLSAAQVASSACGRREIGRHRGHSVCVGVAEDTRVLGAGGCFDCFRSEKTRKKAQIVSGTVW